MCWGVRLENSMKGLVVCKVKLVRPWVWVPPACGVSYWSKCDPSFSYWGEQRDLLLPAMGWEWCVFPNQLLGIGTGMSEARPNTQGLILSLLVLAGSKI